MNQTTSSGRAARWMLGSVGLAVTLVAACAGPPVTTPIEGEPICPDFAYGGGKTNMRGALHFPVQVTIKRGSTVAFRTTVVGLRDEKAVRTRIQLPDDNESYSVEWAQCENERVPRRVDDAGHDARDAAKYECGEATVYQTDKLETKKGDPASHKITFVPGPKPACWQGTVNEAPKADADAGAPDVGDAGSPELPDAGAPDTGTDPDAGDASTANDADTGGSDAGPAASTSASATASAAPTVSASASASASAAATASKKP